MTQTILLVDDEPGIRKVLEISLSEMGYRVMTAENGQAALQRFRAAHPPIVLLDIKMPGMDGIDVLQRMKRENPETEVIIITGHGDMELAIQSLKYEATDFITKPIHDDELEKALNKCAGNIVIRQKLKEYTQNLEQLVQQKTEKLTEITRSRRETDSYGAYQRFFEEIPGYAAVIDEKLVLKTANTRLKSDFTYTPRTGAHCYQVLKAKSSPCPQCPALRTFETGGQTQTEHVFIYQNGDEKNVMVWTTPLKTAAGTIDRVMITATDIARILDLKDHLTTLGLMIGSVSHGIKGLLTALDGGVYLLESGCARNDSEKIVEGLEIVRSMAAKIKTMVLDILYYSKERELNLSPVWIESFVGELAKTIQPRLEENKIAFVREIAPKCKNGEYSLDTQQLQIALINILENAADACMEKASPPPPEIRFSVDCDKNHLIFDIEDNGIGMDETTRKHIFNLFYSSKATQGTGIGLYITRNIVQQHRGEIRVDSRPGEGTRFRVTVSKHLTETAQPH